MNEIIERVARAIHNAEWSVDFDKMPPDSVQVACARRQARAAIAAMRVPTEVMVEAVEAADYYKDAETIFSAMIDAALSEPVTKT